MAFRRGLLDSKPSVFTITERSWGFLLELDDGSLVSCCPDRVERWLISSGDRSIGGGGGGGGDGGGKLIQHVGSYSRPFGPVRCVVQRDNDSIITGGLAPTLQMWSLTTWECIESLPMIKGVKSMVKTMMTKKTKTTSTNIDKDEEEESKVVVGLEDGTIEMRRTSDLSLLRSFKMHSSAVICICELRDGSFATASFDKKLKRWSEEGQELQTFTGHRAWVNQVVETKPNTIISASEDSTVKIWIVSPQVCLQTLSIPCSGLVYFEVGMFATASWDGKIRVWSDDGELIEVIDTGNTISTMRRLRDGSIITAASKNRLGIRRLSVYCSL